MIIHLVVTDLCWLHTGYINCRIKQMSNRENFEQIRQKRRKRVTKTRS
jgi:hypothetical protein